MGADISRVGMLALVARRGWRCGSGTRALSRRLEPPEAAAPPPAEETSRPNRPSRCGPSSAYGAAAGGGWGRPGRDCGFGRRKAVRKLIRNLLKPIPRRAGAAGGQRTGLGKRAVLLSHPVTVAEPVLEQDLDDLRLRLREGGHSGERFELHVTGEEALESIAWFLGQPPRDPLPAPTYPVPPQRGRGLGRGGGAGSRRRGVAGLGIPVVTLTDISVEGVPPARLCPGLPPGQSRARERRPR